MNKIDNPYNFSNLKEGPIGIGKALPEDLQEISKGAGVGTSGGAGSGKSFADILTDSVDKVNLHQHQADTAIKELVAGRSKNIHETLLSIEKADASLKLMMQVRNKVLEAYREIMRMQV